MTHTILIQNKVAAADVGSYNRSFVSSGCDLDNGFVFRLDSQNTGDSGYSEVWWTTPPSLSASTLNNVWMNATPEVVVTTDGALKYRGLNQDPRKFYVSASTVGDAFLPRAGDVILVTSDCFTGSKSANTYANASDGSYQLVWGTSQTSNALSFLYLSTTYISIGTGSIDDQRVAAYKMVCVGN